MKSAKEWAAEVVTEPQEQIGRWAVSLEDSEQSVELEDPLPETIVSARSIIERLVERVQADARAPLEEEIAALKTRVAELEEELDHHNARERSERDV